MPRANNPSDAAGLERRLWTPALLATAPEQWFEANDYNSLTLDGSGAASQWNDLSGKDNHATQATAGSRPTWNATGMAGAPCLQQTSPGKSLTHSATPGAGAATGWLLVMLTSLSVYVPAYTTAPASTQWSMCLHPRKAGAGWAATDMNDATELSSTTLTVSTPTLLVAAYDGSTGYRYYTNGGPVETKTITPYAGSGSDFRRIFCGTDAGNCLISGCGFTKANLNEADCQRLAGYLAWRYNVQRQLHPGNPYANKPPEIGQ